MNAGKPTEYLNTWERQVNKTQVKVNKVEQARKKQEGNKDCRTKHFSKERLKKIKQEATNSNSKS